jgi:GNAT superfamily N-acetyltransferase
VIALFDKLLWWLRYPWPRSAIEGRILPLRFSVCPPERISECLSLFQRNEPHGVPSDDRECYRSGLQDGRFLTLIVEEGERLVGTFGIHYTPMRYEAWLCYVLVNPDDHRRGVGTTMLLAALALLPENQSEFSLWIAALPTAAGFYYRLGFVRLGEFEHSSGQLHQVASLRVTFEMISSCRAWLKAAGASLPTSYVIPRAEAALATAPDDVTETSGEVC